MTGKKPFSFLLGYSYSEKVQIPPTFDFRNKAETLLEVGTDAVEAPAELGIAAVLVGAAGVVTHVQLVAALCHGRDSHVHLADGKNALKTGQVTLLGAFFFQSNRTPSGTGRPNRYELHPSGSGIW